MHGFGTREADIPAQFVHLATLKQIHSAACVAAEGRSGVLGQGDALLEDTPGAVVAVKTADCVPILLVDERRRAVAAVHAGWRGTAAGIAGKAVAAMGRRFATRSGGFACRHRPVHRPVLLRSGTGGGAGNSASRAVPTSICGLSIAANSWRPA